MSNAIGYYPMGKSNTKNKIKNTDCTIIVHTVHVKKSDGIAHLKIEYKQTKIKQSINELQIKIIIIHFH